jgi:hypothetical protein
MDRQYKIFGTILDGSIMECAGASGLLNTRLKLVGLFLATGKEYFAIDLSTRDIVFAADVLKVASERVSKRIFQIAYTDQQRLARAKLLRSLGYAVMSVVGNDAAKILLTTFRQENHGIGLFIVGNGGSVQTRKEIVDWLKANYPLVRILVLNPPNETVPDADYNVEQNGPEEWIPLVLSTMSSFAS